RSDTRHADGRPDAFRVSPIDRALRPRKNHIVSRLRVQSFAISIDGYGAGPSQDVDNPLGVNGTALIEWFFPTRVCRRMYEHADAEAGVDNAIAEEAFSGIGAWILGRNMFGPVRAPSSDSSREAFMPRSPRPGRPRAASTSARAAAFRPSGST